MNHLLYPMHNIADVHIGAMPLPPEDHREVELPDAHARKQFAFFEAMNHPHFGMTARVDVAPLLAFAKTGGHSLNRLCVHAVSSAANAVPAFRRRVRYRDADESRDEVRGVGAAYVVEHARVHPSYAVTSAASEAFSFCEVGFAEVWGVFAEAAAAVEEAAQAAPSFEDAPGRDDYLFLSAIPWVHFTGLEHAMHYHPHDSVPRITWGKVLREGARAWLPVSVQAHHAVVDGRAMGAFYEALERYVGGLGVEEG